MRLPAVVLVAMACAAYAAPLHVASIEHVTVEPTGPVLSPAAAVAVMHKNADILEAYVHGAVRAENETSLVLLSEMALTSLNFNRSQMAHFLMELPPLGMNPCIAPWRNDHPAQFTILRRMSCLAARADTYLVFNWGDRVPCHKIGGNRTCPADGHFQFNTEIVMSRNGTFVTKYHKLHTFNATEFDSPTRDEQPPVAFDVMNRAGTELIQRVGVIICFDSMYYDPTLALVKDYGVHTLVLSDWWVDAYAMMAAVSYFQALSRTLGINLITAASTWTQIYPWSSGSGIFSQGNILASFYNQNKSNVVPGNDHVLHALLPSLNGTNALLLPAETIPKRVAEKPLPMCTDYQVFPALRSGVPVEATLRCKNFTCNVSAVPTADSSTAWVAYMDWGFYHMADGNDVYYFEQFCALYQCKSGDTACLRKWRQIQDDSGNQTWASMSVTANIDYASVVFPMALGGDGNVHRAIMRDTWVASTRDPQLSNYPTVTDALGTTFGYKRREGVGNGTDVLIGMSLLARLYSADVQLITNH